MMILAAVLSALLTASGLAVSYGTDLPAGATTILLAAAVYMVAPLPARLLNRRRRGSPG